MMNGLAQMVGKQIRSKILMTGPITLAEYMKLSLTLPCINSSNYPPEVNNSIGGYYMKKDVFGQEGDFITSPEISQMFGEMIAVWGLQTWQQIGGPKKINIVELGPGRGTLGKDILRVFKRFEHLTGNDVSLHLVEISPFLANIQHQTLCPSEIKTALSQQEGLPSLESRSRVIDYKAGLSETKYNSDSEYYRHAIASESGYPVFWYKNIRDVPKEFNFYIAHEFFDALPLHKLQKVDNVWREILIDIDEEHNGSVKTSNDIKFRFVVSRHETPVLKLLQSQYNEILSDSRNHIEISIDALEILEEICTRTNEQGGFSLVIDYGHEGTKEDTFRGFLKHALHDPLINPGSADMTADVDFSFIKKLLRDKVMICGPIAQADFLRTTGISIRLETLLTKCSSEAEKQVLISSHQMLMQDMGSRFLFMSLFPKILEQYLPKLKISAFHENS